MINKGIVRKVEGDTISVEIFKDSACSSCSSCSNKTCGLQQFKYKKGDLKVADIIEFQIPDRKLLKLGFLTYILPVFFMIGGYYVGASLFKLSEGYSILFSFIALFLSMFFLFLVDKYKGDKFMDNITIKKESN